MTERGHDVRLVVLDLETTGLDPSHNRILELAAVIVEHDLTIRKGDGIQHSYHAVIRPNHTPVEKLITDANARVFHEESGLLAEIRNPLRASSLVATVSEVEGEVIAWLQANDFAPGTAMLAGNSVHFDRTFIQRWMPDLDLFLHYRMVDVSAMREAYRRWVDPEFPKKWKERWGPPAHRAMSDIENSINELRFFESSMMMGRMP